MSRSPSKFHVRQSDVTPYSPANHNGTRNFRMISPETVGAKQLEVLVGEVEKGKGAFPHAHPGIEQACYMLDGRADIEIGGERFELAPGEMCFFPVDEMHKVTVTSDKARILVIYAPPYLENPANARK